MTVQIKQTKLRASFNAWRINTNEAAAAITDNCVTVANGGKGGSTTGDGHVEGTFSATTLKADTLKGGNTTASGVLTVGSNTTFNTTTVRVNANTILNGNVIIDTNGNEVFHLGDAQRMRILGQSNGHFLKATNSDTGAVGFAKLRLSDLDPLYSNSSHITLSGSNTNFRSFGQPDNSPGLILRGGVNDEISLYLEGDVNGHSDLYVKLADVDGESRWTIVDSANVIQFWVDSDGNISTEGGLTVAGPSALNAVTATTIQANGNVDVGGDLSVDGTSALNAVTATTVQANGNVDVGGDLSVDGDADVTGDLGVGGTAALNAVTATTIQANGTLDVTGTATFGGDVDVTGDLGVGGTAALNDVTATSMQANGTLNVTGNATFGGDVTATGDIVGTNIDAGGDVNVTGGVDVTGDTDVGGDVNVTGNTAVGGSLIVDGKEMFIFSKVAVNPTGAGAFEYSANVEIEAESYDDTLNLVSDDVITLEASANSDAVFIGHADQALSSTTSSATLAYSGTFTAIDSVTTNAQGHITGINTKTLTMPADVSAPGSLEVVNDTTPQLGGNLDVNGHSIVSESAGNIAITPDTTGSIVLDGLNWPQADGTANQVLGTDGSGQLVWVDAGASSDEDTVNEFVKPVVCPKIDVGGDGDNGIVSTNDEDIKITPDGTGQIVLDTLNWPKEDGTNGQVLTTDGSGNLSWSDDDGGISVITELDDVNSSMTPGNGQVLTWSNTLSKWTAATVTSGEGGDGIALSDLSVGAEGTASGDGSIAYDNTTGVFTYTPPVIPDAVTDLTDLGIDDGTNGQVLTTDGSGNFSFTTIAGGGDAVALTDISVIELDPGPRNFLDYNSANGTFTFTPVNLSALGLTDLDIEDGTAGQVLSTDGAGNFSFISVAGGGDAITLADLSVGPEASASGDGGISYNNSTGAFTYTPPVIPSDLTDLSIDDGTNGQVLTTDGSGNFSFTTVTGATLGSFTVEEEDPGTRTILDYNNTTGKFTFTPVDLTGYASEFSDLGITDGTAGQVLSTDGNGNYSFITVSNFASNGLSIIERDPANRSWLDYNASTGVFTYTPVDISGITAVSELTDLGITDGTSGQVLTTDGSGNFSFTTVSGGNIASASIEELADVATMTPTDGQVLTWDSSTSKWNAEDAPAGGGASSIEDLNDVATMTPTDGQFLSWDATESLWTAVNAPAGTSLSVTVGAVGVANLVYNNSTGVFTYTPPDLSSFLTSADVATSIEDLNDVALMNPEEGQVLTWDDSEGEWIAADPTGGSGIALTDLSIGTPAAPAGNGDITYNNSTGVFTYTPPNLSSFLTTASIPTELTDLGITDGSSGQVLTTDGSGNFTFTTVSGGNIASASIEELADVASMTPTDGQVLTWDNATSKWTSEDVSTIINNTGATSIEDLNDVALMNPSEGQVLTWDDTEGEWYAADATGGSGIALTDLSIGTPAAPAGNGAITYNSSTGVFTYTPPNLSSYATSTTVNNLELTDLGITDGTSGQVLTTDGSGNFTFTTVSGGSGISNVVEDTTPQLGGNLDLNSSDITGTGDIDITGAITTTGDVTVGGTLYETSDVRVKENVETITGALDKVLAMRGVSFDKDGSKNIGLIAQEVMEVLPEVVTESDDTMLAVAYGNIVGLLIESIKDLKAEIDELKSNK